MTKPTPIPGSKWRHYNGTPYTVLHIANEPDDARYPLMVIYQGPNGKVWARRADDWYRSMTLDLAVCNVCDQPDYCRAHAQCHYTGSWLYNPDGTPRG